MAPTLRLPTLAATLPLIVTALLITIASCGASSRPLPAPSASPTPTVLQLPNLKQRLVFLAGGGGSVGDCWNALLGINSCSNEIVLFFLNGESYLGQDCCRSIRVITRQCWPSMLASVGFTSEEADILRGYCDAETSVGSPPGPSAAGTPAPAVAPSMA